MRRRRINLVTLTGVSIAIALSLGLAFYGAIGYAIYWGLTLAERAVDNAAPTTTHQITE